ncbi:MAG TPA: hypothetical protein VNZ49_05815, partial [Bacteroidia bacterium]|nr:hypothetical protein [Bacteroidia bacterium]
MKLRQLIFFAGCVLFSHYFAIAGEHNPRNISYIQNKGQWDDKVLYQADFRGGRVFLEKNTFTFLFYPAKGFGEMHPHEGGKQEPGTHVFDFQVVKMEFEGCSEAKIDGSEKRDFYHNYFLGNDSKKWAGNVPLYQNVIYDGLYPGISVKTFSDVNNVRYDFIVSPGADPSIIKLKFTGQNDILVKNGNLILKTKVGDIVQQAPFAYQIIFGQKKKIECAYIFKNNSVGIVLGEYDKTQEVIIDPTLVFSTFTGSTADNWGM